MSAGGYCLDCGTANRSAGRGVWECPVCRRRSPEVGEDSRVELGKVLATAFCAEDASQMSLLRGDVLQCPRCRTRKLVMAGQAAPATRKWAVKRRLAVSAPVTGLATVGDREVWVGLHSAERRIESLDRALGRRTLQLELPVIEYAEALESSSGAILILDSSRNRALRTAVRPDRWDESPLAFSPGAVCIDSRGDYVILEKAPNPRLLHIVDESLREREVIDLTRLEAPIVSSVAVTPLERGEDFLLLTRGGACLVCISRGGRVLWQQLLPSAARGTAVAVGAGGGVAVASSDGTRAQVDFFNSVGVLQERLPIGGIPSSLCFDTEGRTLYVGGRDEKVVWEVVPATTSTVGRGTLTGKADTGKEEP